MQCFQSLTSMLRLIYCAHFASLSYSSTSLHGVTVSHRYLSLPVCYHLILIFSNHQRGCSIIKLESFFLHSISNYQMFLTHFLKTMFTQRLEVSVPCIQLRTYLLSTMHWCIQLDYLCTETE